MVSLHVHAATHTVRQTLRLLEDLLQHEVRIATLLNLSEVDVHRLHLQLLILAEDVHHVQVLSQTDHGYIAVLQIHHLVRIFHDGAGVGTQEELILADAHHQRTLLAGGDDLRRIILVEHGDGVGTDHLVECHLHGRQQVELLVVLDILYQLHQHLRVRVADEVYALRLQFRLQVGIVLDDTVVNDGEVLRL